tara:strand:+ start:482 stop:1027 length:546 start_codon:yes stop_codon:yes gene_type:complete
MKKFLLLLLFIPLVSFGQDFRKMSFGESIENLTEKYPDIEFEVEEADGVEIVAHEDNIAGITTVVGYVFQDKKFVTGMYNFESEWDGDEALKNYKSVSERLNAKYKMTENNKWHKDSWKDDPNYHGHALYMGDVDFVERYEGEGKTVLHSISKSDDELLHIVMYMNPEFENKLSQQNADDF